MLALSGRVRRRDAAVARPGRRHDEKDRRNCKSGEEKRPGAHRMRFYSRRVPSHGGGRCERPRSRITCVAEDSTVELPGNVREPFEVFVNGCRSGAVSITSSRDGPALPKHLAQEGLGVFRWASIFLGIAGTYRKNDSVDVVFEVEETGSSPRGCRSRRRARAESDHRDLAVGLAPILVVGRVHGDHLRPERSASSPSVTRARTCRSSRPTTSTSGPNGG